VEGEKGEGVIKMAAPDCVKDVYVLMVMLGIAGVVLLVAILVLVAAILFNVNRIYDESQRVAKLKD
jgi:hypothetical protein